MDQSYVRAEPIEFEKKNWLKLEILGELPIIFKESIEEYTSNG
jgi:hypothetical protein